MAAESVRPDQLWYQYRPLGDRSIRLLELLPGSAQDGMRCRLRSAGLDDMRVDHPYEALSYVWGDTGDQVTIACDDACVVSISRSLLEALHALRDPISPRIIWADAICINQRDDAERSRQVRLIDAIYRNARRVVVWLGADTEGVADSCFGLIWAAGTYLGRLWRDYDDMDAIPVINLPDPISRPIVWEPASRLLGLPWFSRVWVVQEVAVARECVLTWGDCQMPIVHLVELVIWMQYRTDLREACGLNIGAYATVAAFGYGLYGSEGTWRASPFLQTFQDRYIANREWSMVHVLRAGRSLRATLDVDHLYAFLGNPLADGVGLDGDDDDDGGGGGGGGPRVSMIEPDYAKPVEQVFLEAACTMLRNPRDAPHVLPFVVHLSGADVEGRDCPSWVPRWDNGVAEHLGSSPSYWYRAGGVGISFRAHIREEKLVLRGLLFDRLSWTSEVIQLTNLSLDPRAWDEGAWRASPGETYLDYLWDTTQRNLVTQSSIAADLEQGKLEDAFFLALARGFCEEASPPTGSRLAKYRGQYHAFRRALRQLQGGHHPLPRDVLEQAYRFSHEISFRHDERLAATRAGSLALVPRFSRPGDVCCVLPGSSMPLILRPVAGGDAFNLVGAAYIHGVMRGELLGESKEDPDKWGEIVLA